jgi:glycosyltransferase involved in cell wall biosynthesis
MNEKVSVVTVCYNTESLIEDTIKSVVGQAYPNIEYIVIDGGSTDDTVKIIKKYDSKISYWVSEPDGGIYDAMNKGIKAATGKWINFMNAGDAYCSETSVEQFVRMVDDDVVIAFGDTVLKYQLGRRLKRAEPVSLLSSRMPFGHQATFVDVDYHKHHLFDTTFRSSGDYKFFHDAYESGAKFHHIPIPIAVYKAEDGVSSSNWKLVAREDARIMGIDNTLKWKIKYLLMGINIGFRNVIKACMPRSVVKKIQYKNMLRIGEEIE